MKSGVGVGWGTVLAVFFGLLAVGLLYWALVLDTNLQTERQARRTAQGVAESERAERQAAVQQAQAELRLRATAEAIAIQEAASRQQAEAAQVKAESVRDKAESDRQSAVQRAQIESRLRAAAEAEAEKKRVAAQRKLALQVAKTSPTVKAIATGELWLYIEPLPEYAADGVQDAVDNSINTLEDGRPYGTRIRETKDEDGADIYVRWVRDYGDHILGRAINQTVIHVGLGANTCTDEWQAFDASTIKLILWHEFGHTFGYGHSDDPGNIMWPSMETRPAIENHIDEVISPGWAWRIPVCGSGDYQFALETENGNHAFDFVVVRGDVSWDAFWDEDYSFYRNCKRRSWQRLTQTCNLSSGADVFITNPDSETAIRVRGQIVPLDEPARPDMTWDSNAFLYDDETLDYYRGLFG